ncbi:uncharacterized protein LOC124136749 isoform X2 [Haliotis rufescens]|uniref:uncharacterized protein LOC124136749 isoform X2 n=1 Tax=Haliotis rufescens TaxID=6454 RepID=UPI00201F795E|nr:uncharacterized protein LOC124136749 isoform X2 [Haliotis rufescens]
MYVNVLQGLCDRPASALPTPACSLTILSLALLIRSSTTGCTIYQWLFEGTAWIAVRCSWKYHSWQTQDVVIQRPRDCRVRYLPVLCAAVSNNLCTYRILPRRA